MLLLSNPYLLTCAINKSEDGRIHFFQNQYSHSQWKSIQEHLDTLFTQGEFELGWKDPNFKTMFWHPCFYEDNQVYLKWGWGICHDSPYNRGNIWQWKPSTKSGQPHRLHTWSPDKMCKLMNGRNIAFVGDSMSLQTQFTFISAMHRDLLIPKRQLNDTKYIKGKRERLQNYCENYCPMKQRGKCFEVDIDCGAYPPFKSFVLMDDFLSPEKPWIKRTKELNVSLIVMNSGAHFISTDERVRNIDESLRNLFALHDVSIIFRTTPPGHPRCDSLFYSHPIDGTYYNYSDEENKPYHYNEFVQQSLVVVEMLRRKYPQVLTLNVHNVTSHRADSHPLFGDCLHYCIPGPVNTWIEFLYHSLTVLQQDHRSDGVTHGHGDQRQFVSENVIEPLFRPRVEVAEGMVIHPSSGYRRYLNRVGEDSFYLWSNGSRHRMDEKELAQRNISKSSVKYIDLWRYMDFPIGWPISP